MATKEIDGIRVEMPDGMADEEAQQYVKRGKAKYGSKLRGMEIKLPDDEQDALLYYDVPPMKFHRLRRITGYLVGTLDRWSDGKRAEERDRVKHGV